MELSRRQVIAAGAALPLAVAGSAQAARPPAALKWAGHSWYRRSGTGGPGPNSWDGTLPHVDSDGRLHLRIARTSRGWACSEVFGPQLGFGTYAWTFEVPAAGLDPRVVLGLFTYETDTRETDIELARWDGVDGHNAQWAVQPATADNVRRFDVADGARVTARYTWTSSGTATFSGEQTAGGVTTALPGWSTTRATTSRRGKVHMNLWLFQGLPPRDGQEVDVVVSDFRFTAP